MAQQQKEQPLDIESPTPSKADQVYAEIVNLIPKICLEIGGEIDEATIVAEAFSHNGRFIGLREVPEHVLNQFQNKPSHQPTVMDGSNGEYSNNFRVTSGYDSQNFRDPSLKKEEKNYAQEVMFNTLHRAVSQIVRSIILSSPEIKPEDVQHLQHKIEEIVKAGLEKTLQGFKGPIFNEKTAQINESFREHISALISEASKQPSPSIGSNQSFKDQITVEAKDKIKKEIIRNFEEAEASNVKLGGKFTGAIKALKKAAKDIHLDSAKQNDMDKLKAIYDRSVSVKETLKIKVATSEITQNLEEIEILNSQLSGQFTETIGTIKNAHADALKDSNSNPSNSVIVELGNVYAHSLFVKNTLKGIEALPEKIKTPALEQLNKDLLKYIKSEDFEEKENLRDEIDQKIDQLQQQSEIYWQEQQAIEQLEESFSLIGQRGKEEGFILLDSEERTEESQAASVSVDEKSVLDNLQEANAASKADTEKPQPSTNSNNSKEPAANNQSNNLFSYSAQRKIPEPQKTTPSRFMKVISMLADAFSFFMPGVSVIPKMQTIDLDSGEKQGLESSFSILNRRMGTTAEATLSHSTTNVTPKSVVESKSCGPITPAENVTSSSIRENLSQGWIQSARPVQDSLAKSTNTISNLAF